MKVIKAKTAGFCFGVKRAVDTVYEQVKEQGDGGVAPAALHLLEVAGGDIQDF